MWTCHKNCQLNGAIEMVKVLSKLQGVEPDIPEILCATAPSKLLAPFCGCNVDHFCSWNCPHKHGKLEASCSTITQVLEHLDLTCPSYEKKSCNFASHILLYALILGDKPWRKCSTSILFPFKKIQEHNVNWHSYLSYTETYSRKSSKVHL
jgi:hypothetical protein